MSKSDLDERKFNIAKHAREWAEHKPDDELLRTLIEQEKLFEDVMSEAEANALSHKVWAETIKAILLGRMNESGVKSLAIDEGRVSRIETTNYSIDDPEQVYNYVVSTGSIALFGSKVIKRAVEDAIESTGECPAGIKQHKVYSLRLTKGK